MKKIAIEDAIGETLCHDITAILPNGHKGVRFKRGHLIRPEDVPAFRDLGKNHVYIWEPAADEVHEDDAALAVTAAICGENLTWTGPSEGKMLIHSAIDGLFCLNSPALRQINQVEDFTVACLPGFSRVSQGQALAGARIMPLVTRRSRLDAAVALARTAAPVMMVRPFRPLRCALIITGSEIYEGRIPDRFAAVLTPKLQSYGGEIIKTILCPDDLAAILAAIFTCRDLAADLILLTGGMSVDPDDLTPGAIRQSGAEIITQGVPMQPGNMLTLAKLGSTTLIGVPGASLHSPTTSLDVFLPRVFAGVEITRDEIAGYGEGGFCRQCNVCHYPICYFGQPLGRYTKC